MWTGSVSPWLGGSGEGMYPFSKGSFVVLIDVACDGLRQVEQPQKVPQPSLCESLVLLCRT